VRVFEGAEFREEGWHCSLVLSGGGGGRVKDGNSACMLAR
jgi:hypothetical protein